MTVPRPLRTALLPLALACLAAAPGRAQTYSVTDLGTTFYTTGSFGSGVSNTGQVVGDIGGGNDFSDAVLAVAAASGPPTITVLAEEGHGMAINNAGQIALTYAGPIWQAGRLTVAADGTTSLKALGTLGGQKSWATGINSVGQVCGYSATAAGPLQAFLATVGASGSVTMNNLGTFAGGQSFATGVNTAGQVCGYGGTVSNPTHAFLYNGSAMIDLGVLPGATFSQATGIGPGGQVVGYSGSSTSVYTAFVYANGVMASLGALGGTQSQANAINSAGQIVGSSATAGGTTHAFLYTTGGGMTDLNALLPAGSGWTLTSANGISDNGNITGAGTIHGAQHAFLLKPGGTTPTRSWTATAVSAGADGFTRLLWDRTDGTASVWKVSGGGQLVTQQQYGPFGGVTAKAIATGSGFGTASAAYPTSVLWNGVGDGGVLSLGSEGLILNGALSIPANGVTAAQGLAAQPTVITHAFAATGPGTAKVWTVAATIPGYANLQTYGPYAGWTARSIAVNPDATVRLLWTNTDGTATFWHLSATNQMIDQHQYGPYAGYTATAIAAASDGTARVVWTATDGHIALWTLDAGNTYTGQSQYGPYSGWTFQALAIGSDGNARLLWDNVSGQAALWSLTPGGSFASNYQYGPF